MGIFKSAKTPSESCEHFANVIYRRKAGADKEHQMQKRKARQDSQPPNLSQLSKSRKENALQKIEEMWDIIEFRVCLSADIAKRLLNFGGKSLSLTGGEALLREK